MRLLSEAYSLCANGVDGGRVLEHQARHSRRPNAVTLKQRAFLEKTHTLRKGRQL